LGERLLCKQEVAGSIPAGSISSLVACVDYAPTIAKALPPEFLEQFDEQFDCWNRGELDQMLELYAEDAVFDVSAVFTDVSPMHGREDIRRYWGTLREIWDGIRLDPLEGFELEDGRFVIDQRWWSKGTRSGIEIDQRMAILYTLRPDDRKIVHAKLFPDVATAIAAAETPASRA
jgi:ketosteroid isomerase-like protein